MSGMDDRQKAFEKKYALDQELMFRIEARASKLFALWLAGQAGLNDEESKAFATTIISANLDEPGFEDVKRAIQPLLSEKSLKFSEAEIDSKLEHFMEEARKQITTEQK